MFQRAIYIYLTVLWLSVGIGLLFRHDLFPDWELTEGQTNRVQWIYAMAFVFAAWNVLRYGLYRMGRRTAPVTPSRRRDLSSPPA